MFLLSDVDLLYISDEICAADMSVPRNSVTAKMTGEGETLCYGCIARLLDRSVACGGLR